MWLRAFSGIFSLSSGQYLCPTHHHKDSQYLCLQRRFKGKNNLLRFQLYQNRSVFNICLCISLIMLKTRGLWKAPTCHWVGSGHFRQQQRDSDMGRFPGSPGSITVLSLSAKRTVVKFHFKFISEIQNKGLLPQSCQESSSLSTTDINTRTSILVL